LVERTGQSQLTLDFGLWTLNFGLYNHFLRFKVYHHTGSNSYGNPPEAGI
jgi:hypothetical protein